MAKFKVGDKVQCAALNLEDDDAIVDASSGVIVEVDEVAVGDKIYLVKVDLIAIHTDDNEWWYDEDQLSPITRTTTIEWYTPDERMPQDGEKVVWMWDNEICGGYFRGDMFVDVLDSWSRISEVQFWAYAPDVK